MISNRSFQLENTHQHTINKLNSNQLENELAYELLARNHQKVLKNPRNYSCTFENCNKSFGTKGNLKAHEALHITERRFRCRIEGCDKCYINKCRLHVHERTHDGMKPFICEKCDKGFNEKGNLKIHMRVHTGERPYKCQIVHCKKSFKTKGHLKDHVKIHIDYKPYKCSQCCKKFARLSTLKVHSKIHSSGDKSYSEAIHSQVETEKIESSSLQTSNCAFSKFENLVTTNFIQVYIKNDYNRNILRSFEALETEGKTVPSNQNTPHEKNFFDSQFFMNDQNESFIMYLNNMCNGEENNFSMEHINSLINRDSEDYMCGYMN